MFKLPQLSSIDFPSIDFSRLDVNALRNSDVAKRFAAIDLPTIDTEKVAAVVRDAAYLTVGLGVVAVEQAQVRRRKIAARASERMSTSKPRVEALRGTVESRLVRIDAQVDALGARIDSVVDRLEAVLPEQAGLVVGQARDITRVARKQVRGLIRSAA